MGQGTDTDHGALEQSLGYRFQNERICSDALTHKSWLNERPGASRSHNERLEFLGDAVLALVVSDLLMKRFPDHAEGELSKARASIVSESSLAQAAQAIDLGRWLFLGRGEEQAGGRGRPSILANAFEAVVGAVFCDGGFPAAYGVIERLFAAAVLDTDKAVQRDFKSRLQERAQAGAQGGPQYVVVATDGPDHDRTFEVEVAIGGRVYGRASGKSKKEAEQNAAALALEALDRGDGGAP